MRPSRTDEDALVDLLDVLLRDGVIVEADVIVSVADIPLVGVKLRAAIAGMTTMTEYGMFESFDRAHRARTMEGDVQREPVSRIDAEVPVEEGGADEDVPTQESATSQLADEILPGGDAIGSADADAEGDGDGDEDAAGGPDSTGNPDAGGSADSN